MKFHGAIILPESKQSGKKIVAAFGPAESEVSKVSASKEVPRPALGSYGPPSTDSSGLIWHCVFVCCVRNISML